MGLNSISVKFEGEIRLNGVTLNENSIQQYYAENIMSIIEKALNDNIDCSSAVIEELTINPNCEIDFETVQPWAKNFTYV